MREDFGYFGDEIFLNHCAEDYLDTPATIEFWRERQREREVRAADLAEQEVDDAWDAMNERDLCDVVREHDEEYGDPDYPDGVGQDISEFDEEADDYLDCDWRE